MKRQSKPTISHIEFIDRVIKCDEKGEPFSLAPCQRRVLEIMSVCRCRYELSIEYVLQLTTKIILGIVPATALACGLPGGVLFDSAKSNIKINLVHDSSFEERSPRGLTPYDRPWGGEEEGSPAGVEIMQGAAADGKQFLRMQFVRGAGPECPGCNQAFLFQRIDVSPNTDYIFSYWIRGTTSVSSGIQIPFLDDCHNYPPPPNDPTRPNLCPDDDGDEEVDLGPTPPNYEKEYVAKYDSDTPASNTKWLLISHGFNSGPHSVLYVRFFNVYSGSDHTDIDNVSVVAAGAS